MYQIQNFFAPSIGPPGLSIFVEAGVLSLNGQGLVIPSQTVSLPASATSFVYLNTSTGAVQNNTSGYPSSNCYSIATVITTASGVRSLVDNRPDIPASSGGSSFPSIVASFSATAQNESITDQVLLAVAIPGLYRLSFYIVVTFGATQSTITPDFDYTDLTGAQVGIQMYAASGDPNTLASQGSASSGGTPVISTSVGNNGAFISPIFRSAGHTAVSFDAVIATQSFQSPIFDIDVVLERLQ